MKLTKEQERVLRKIGFKQDSSGSFTINIEDITKFKIEKSATSGFYVDTQEDLIDLFRVIYEDGYETGQMYFKKVKA